jgi:hypothetical protein
VLKTEYAVRAAWRTVRLQPCGFGEVDAEALAAALGIIDDAEQDEAAETETEEFLTALSEE